MVSLKSTESESEEDSVSKLLKEAKDSFKLSEVGVDSISVRAGRDGSVLLVVDTEKAADGLAARLRSLGDERVTISRPERMASIKITNVDITLSDEELAEEISRMSGCPTDKISAKIMRGPQYKIGLAWIRCPAKFAADMAEMGMVTVGWTQGPVGIK